MKSNPFRVDENEKTTRMELIKNTENCGGGGNMLRFTYYVKPECEKLRGRFCFLLYGVHSLELNSIHRFFIYFFYYYYNNMKKSLTNLFVLLFKYVVRGVLCLCCVCTLCCCCCSCWPLRTETNSELFEKGRLVVFTNDFFTVYQDAASGEMNISLNEIG